MIMAAKSRDPMARFLALTLKLCCSLLGVQGYRNHSEPLQPFCMFALLLHLSMSHANGGGGHGPSLPGCLPALDQPSPVWLPNPTRMIIINI